MSIKQYISRETPKHHLNQGFTLVEVITVVVILAIIGAIGIPNIMAWISNNRLRAAANEFFSNLQHTKSESIKRNKNVVVLLTAVDCSGSIPSAGGSYTIFVDDGSGAGAVAGDNIQNGSEPTLKQVVLSQGTALCATTFLGSKTGFTPAGRPVNLNSGSVTLQNTNAKSNTISVGIAGSVTLD